MTRTTRLAAICVTAAVGAAAVAEEYKSGIKWEDPPAVTPAAEPGQPPSDAVVLFDGKDLSAWHGAEGWEVKDGVAIPKKGGITTKQPFGDIQLHVEWATPEKVEGSGQGRGNSGVYLMGKYEVQVLDSFENPTYVDGSAGSLYKQWPPLVNASRKPGEWQTYDIAFTAPRFDENKALVRPGYVTVFQNGVLVQNHSELTGGTSWDSPPKYEAHPEKLPIQLQFHGNPVRFRNIWLRELKDRKPEYPTPKAEDRTAAAPVEKTDGAE